jgi:lipopolysaccharide/colanic/teichoic acid biosynthesis glycosyltransferase
VRSFSGDTQEVMMRFFESVIALVLVVIVLPLFVFAWVGLMLGGATPILVVRDVSISGEQERRWVFNTVTCGFGLFLRRYSIEKLPSLLWVVSGKLRLADLG